MGYRLYPLYAIGRIWSMEGSLEGKNQGDRREEEGEEKEEEGGGGGEEEGEQEGEEEKKEHMRPALPREKDPGKKTTVTA